MVDEIIRSAIADAIAGTIKSERVVSYIDYKAKYTVLKPTVRVTIELTSGKILTLDVSDEFEKELKGDK